MATPLARRTFITSATAFGAAALVASPLGAARRHEEDVSPVEDLMREHGVLRRVLLVYDEVLRRIDRREKYPVEVLPRAAEMVRTFVEDYHERLEEDFLFPRFEKADMLTALVATLRTQHHRGRALTAQINQLGTPGALKGDTDRRALGEALRAFVRMYRPHAAHEDTILFPALKELVGKKGYKELGEEFEDKEHALFGEDGFSKMVVEVGRLEQLVGLAGLGQFTPK
jgi:hemerythrin-like domain-containing protein